MHRACATPYTIFAHRDFSSRRRARITGESLIAPLARRITGMAAVSILVPRTSDEARHLQPSTWSRLHGER